MGLATWLNKFLNPGSADSASGAKATSRPSSTVYAPAFDTWKDPAPMQCQELWAKRLNAYAKKCAAELEGAKVARWTSRKKIGDWGTFHDAFWLVSVDVEGADMGPLPHSLQEGVTNSSLRGYALLLTRSGMLCTSKVFMGYARGFSYHGGYMDSNFKNIQQNESLLRISGWDRSNLGDWKMTGSRAGRRGYSIDANHTFGPRYAPGSFSGDNPGLGSSAALSRFLKSGGEVGWPRNF